jgi:hypothetical protein
MAKFACRELVESADFADVEITDEEDFIDRKLARPRWAILWSSLKLSTVSGINLITLWLSLEFKPQFE